MSNTHAYQIEIVRKAEGAIPEATIIVERQAEARILAAAVEDYCQNFARCQDCHWTTHYTEVEVDKDEISHLDEAFAVIKATVAASRV
jgi:hypothetical protein